jgi:hypothetical protein
LIPVKEEIDRIVCGNAGGQARGEPSEVLGTELRRNGGAAFDGARGCVHYSDRKLTLVEDGDEQNPPEIRVLVVGVFRESSGGCRQFDPRPLRPDPGIDLPSKA